MAEYIDREKLLLLMDFNAKHGCAICNGAECVACFEQWVAEIPTANVVEVVHARWEYLDEFWDDTIYRCTACKNDYAPLEMTYEDFIEQVKFCPNCGAKMDLE